ncbi:hypothetical protein MMC22_003619 [Lobaria immixta]|nr:hypothetical protein [Lobaria immixta]
MKKSTSKRARSQRAKKAYLKRQAILEAGQEPTLSKTSGAAYRRCSREKLERQMIGIRPASREPQSYLIRTEERRSAPSNPNREADSNLSHSMKGRGRLPYRSNFLDHEEPSEDSDDSDFFVGDGESEGEESDNVESSETDESIYIDGESPDGGLLDLVSEEQLLAHLEEWARNVREPRLRPRRTRGHPPDNQLAFEEDRLRQYRTRSPLLSDYEVTLELYRPLRRTLSRSPDDYRYPLRWSRSPLRCTREPSSSDATILDPALRGPLAFRRR